MKVEELRIGNLLRDKVTKTELKVIELTEQDIVTYVIDRSMFPLKDGWGIEPIPLSQEWLIKFGFDGVNSANKLIQVGWNGDDFIHDQMSVLFKGVFITTLKYVHQLQNLYFTLTGEELTLNP
jgi:hypothetical protein